jgi:hypothetical protein
VNATTGTLVLNGKDRQALATKVAQKTLPLHEIKVAMSPD